MFTCWRSQEDKLPLSRELTLPVGDSALRSADLFGFFMVRCEIERGKKSARERERERERGTGRETETEIATDKERGRNIKTDRGVR